MLALGFWGLGCLRAWGLGLRGLGFGVWGLGLSNPPPPRLETGLRTRVAGIRGYWASNFRASTCMLGLGLRVSTLG